MPKAFNGTEDATIVDDDKQAQQGQQPPGNQKPIEDLNADEPKKDGKPDDDTDKAIEKYEQREKEHAELVKKAKELIQKEGKDAISTLGKIIQPNQITFIEPPLFQVTPDLIKAIPEGTRIALDLPESLAPLFKQFNDSPKGAKLKIPDSLPGADTAEGLDLLRRTKEAFPENFKNWETLHDRGVKIMPVGRNDLHTELGDPTDPEMLADNKKTETHYADRIAKLYREDNKTPIVAIMFGGHGAKARSKQVPFTSAADLIAQNNTFKANKGKIVSIDSITSGIDQASPKEDLPTVVNKATIMATRNANGKPNALGQMRYSPQFVNDLFGYNEDAFDYLLIHKGTLPAR